MITFSPKGTGLTIMVDDTHCCVVNWLEHTATMMLLGDALRIAEEIVAKRRAEAKGQGSDEE